MYAAHFCFVYPVTITVMGILCLAFYIHFYHLLLTFYSQPCSVLYTTGYPHVEHINFCVEWFALDLM